MEMIYSGASGRFDNMIETSRPDALNRSEHCLWNEVRLSYERSNNRLKGVVTPVPLRILTVVLLSKPWTAR